MSALEVESFRPVLTPERNLQSTPYLFWFSGAGCTMDTGLQLRNQLEADDAFGQGNMRFIPSIISVEKPDRAKYDDIARHMIQLSKQGRRIISVVHSFGLVEQAAVFQKIREIDPDFFEQDFTDRFDVLHSPHGEIDLHEKVQKAIKKIDGRIMHDFDHKESDRLVEDLQE